MSAPTEILRAIAEEIAKTAKANMPIQDGETVLREWLENGAYHRESKLNGIIVKCEYDLKLKKVRRTESKG